MTAESLALQISDLHAADLMALVTSRDVTAGHQPLEWDPLAVTPHQEAALDQLPAVEVIVRSDQVTGRETAEDGTDYDRVLYLLRVFYTVRGEDYADTDRRRKRIAAAGRELLRHVPDARVGALRTSYSETTRDRNGRTLGAAYIDVSLEVYEPAVTAPRAPGSAPAPPNYVYAVGIDVQHID